MTQLCLSPRTVDSFAELCCMFSPQVKTPKLETVESYGIAR